MEREGTTRAAVVDAALGAPADVVEISNLSALYGRIVALDDISMRVGQGECLALFGANGAGKSTLMNVISGAMPYSGSVRVFGRPVSGGADRMARSGVGHVLEGRRVLAHLTVTENLQLARFCRGRANWQEDLDRVLSVFPELSPKMKDYAGKLSGGQQQILAVSRALLARPKLLLMDEPSLGLAPVVAQRLLEQVPLIRKTWNTTVVVAEQRVALAVGLADRYVILQKGRIVNEGDGAQLALLKAHEVAELLGLASAKPAAESEETSP